MALRFGNDALEKIYFGKKRIGKIYVGGLLVYAIEMYEKIIIDRLYHTPVDGADVKKSGLLKINGIMGNGEIINQLVGVNDSSITLVAGHKYLTFINNVWALATGSGQSQAVAGGTDMIVDLTQQFGTGNEPTSLSDNRIKRIIVKGYIPKNNGTYEGMTVQRFEDKGFNIWDEQWEVGSIDSVTGAPISGNYVRSKNYISVISDETYYLKTANRGMWLYYYDVNYSFLGESNAFIDRTTLIENNVHYIKFVMSGNYGTIYNHDICINLSCSRNGQYVPARWQDFYEEVEYIESSGTQYIDSGYKPNYTTCIDTVFSITSSAANFIFGTRTNATINAYTYYVRSNGVNRSDYGTQMLDMPQTTNVNEKVHIIKDQNKTYYNGILSSTANEQRFSTAYTLLICALHDAVTPAYFGYIRIYSCKIYDNNILVRDFIPVYRKSDHKPGLYDRVNNVFYVNSGTGEFALGPNKKLPEEYREVEYIESTGTQYIDLEVKGNQDSKVEIVAMRIGTDTVTGYRLFGSRISTTQDGFFISSNLKNNVNEEYANYAEQSISASKIALNVKQKFMLSKEGYAVDNIMLSTFTYSAFTTPTNLLLFGGDANGAISTWPWRVYSCKLYDNNVLIRDFVPCYRITDRKPGLYDKVNSKFYVNSGTGEFVIGPDVELPAEYQELEYIESTGTQYVDSGVITGPGTWIQDADVQFTQLPAKQQWNGADVGYYWGIVNGQYFVQTSGASLSPNKPADTLRHHFVSNVTHNQQNNTFYIDGVSYASDRQSTRYGQLEIRICDVSTGFCYERVYGYKILKDNVLLRNFIPARRLADNEVGLYDKVNDKFYSNQGSGEFIAGPDINMRTAVMLPQPIKLNGAINAHDMFEVTDTTYRFTRNVWKVDLGTCSYTYDSQYTRFRTTNFVNTIKASETESAVANALCTGYIVGSDLQYWNGQTNKSCFVTTGASVYFVNHAYTDATAFKSAMSGVPFYYELAVPQVINIPKKHLGYVKLKDLNFERDTDYNRFRAQVAGMKVSSFARTCELYTIKYRTLKDRETFDPNWNLVIYNGALNEEFIYIHDHRFTTVADLVASFSDSDVLFYETQNEVSDSLISLPFQKGGELNGQQYEIPVEYQKVEYVESTGTQYIDTGMVGNENTAVMLDFKHNEIYSETEQRRFFGSETTGNTNAFVAGISATGKFFTQFDSIVPSSIITFDNDTNRHTLSLSKNGFYFDGQLTRDYAGYTSFTTPSNLLLFAFYNGGIISNNAKMNVYSCKIYDNNQLVRNFVPCYRKSDGTIGLYDTVNDKFYTNSGTGTFLKGPDVSQIIDCEVLPNVTIDAQKS